MTVIRGHHDADGITSAFFTSFGVPHPVIEIWNGSFGDTTGLNSGDYMVDMRPKQNLKGLNVIDHHGPYPLDRKYNLTTDDVPASYICWNKFKDKIPKEEWWKLAIGLMGDGQPELIPYEIHEMCPQLRSQYKTSSKYYYKWNVNYFPTYKLLSSPINSLLRIGKMDSAVKLITESKNPLDILNNVEANEAKEFCKKERDKLIHSSKSYDFSDLAIFIFESDIRMSGYLASVMQNALNKTVICINSKSGRGSLRGDLSLYYRDKLKHLDYLIIDGHPGFMGVSITENPDVFIYDLIDII